MDEEVNEIIILGVGNSFVFRTTVGSGTDGRLHCRIIAEELCCPR